MMSYFKYCPWLGIFTVEITQKNRNIKDQSCSYEDLLQTVNTPILYVSGLKRHIYWGIQNNSPSYLQDLVKTKRVFYSFGYCNYKVLKIPRLITVRYGNTYIRLHGSPGIVQSMME